MACGSFLQVTLKFLDWLAHRTGRMDAGAAHHATGRRGEEAAYFYLRRRGYILVARNFRTPQRRGEIDLIGWDRDVLCFIEVKTRTSHQVKPAGAAVDISKQRELAAVARQYLRHLPEVRQWRFDVISVYYEGECSVPVFELFQNAFPVA
ncbi:MAG: YraN family protein [Acidobacteria bacterium]|jgi:putative endonuclease|nr:YraN family protein [Acidobacteriota bacterium]